MMKKTALLLIDIQKGFDDLNYWGGQRNNLNAEKNMETILHAWRQKKWPIIHIQHQSTNPQSPLHPSHEGFDFKQETAPKLDEVVIQKNVNSAFIGTELDSYLSERQIMHLVIVGLTTDHCVSTTTRMAGNLGFDVDLIADATATFTKKRVDNGLVIDAEIVHQIHLASLNNEFCNILTTQQLIRKIEAN